MKQRGFTLIEVLVSTAIFTVVMVIALGALLAMSEADRKAQTLKSVMDNLNFSLDAMTRAVRTGYSYSCDSGLPPDLNACNALTAAKARSYFSFISADGQKIEYCLSAPESQSICGSTATVVCTSGSCSVLRRIEDGEWTPLTSPEIKITALRFVLFGAQPGGDLVQPKVTILLSGYVDVTASQRTTFNLQTSVTQRIYDQ